MMPKASGTPEGAGPKTVHLVLEVASGPSAGTRAEACPGQPLRVGRAEQVELRIPDDALMSRQHFAVDWAQDGCRLRDLGSSHGTTVNGSRVSEAVLRDGDRIVAGWTEFAVYVGRVPPQTVRIAPARPTVRLPNAGPTAPATPVRRAPADPVRNKSVPPAAPSADRPTVIPTAPSPPSAPVVPPPSDPDAGAESPAPVLQIINGTPYRVAFMVWEDLEGKPKLTVIVKATFSIKSDGTVADAPEPLPVFTQDQHFRDDPNATVRFESDLVPFKPRADVVLVGQAHAPHGELATQVDVSLRVGRLKKTIRVFGDRKWQFASRVSLVPHVTPPEPFETMDLVYERAFGGIDPAAARYCPENLAGTSLVGAVTWASVQDRQLPNLEDPDDLIRTPTSRPRPVGWGFYGRGWMPRLGYAGTYDDRYRAERAPALPADFSYAVYNGAHPDLQVEGYLRGDEAVELENLGPQPRLRFRLPSVRPKVTVSRWTMPSDEWLAEQADRGQEDTEQRSPFATAFVPLVLDTLVFLPEQNAFYQVFRGVCPLSRLDPSEVAVIRVSK